jgi:ribosomal protein S12 methylthiotransferase
MKREPKICNYIDIPLQYFRFYLEINAWNNTRKNQIIKDFRAAVPEMAIRTTLIVGYPGETQEDFNILKDWVQEMKFDRMGCFAIRMKKHTCLLFRRRCSC